MVLRASGALEPLAYWESDLQHPQSSRRPAEVLMAFRCLQLMNSLLAYNICGLEDPSVANADIFNLTARLHEKVSEALRYVCAYWTVHLTALSDPDHRLLEELVRFCSKHLFHWLEVLSLTDSVSSGERGLAEVLAWCEVRHPNSLLGTRLNTCLCRRTSVSLGHRQS
jgi:hypothetical protein